MSVLEKAVSDKMKKYLRDVRNFLESNAVDKEEIGALLDNLRCHALETAAHHMENMSLEDAVNRTVASLDAPEIYAAYAPPALSAEKRAVIDSSGRFGKLSALTMILALLLAVLFSQHKLFDTPPSGSIFIFGEMLALGTGIASWPNIWAKVGTLCSGLLLAFLATAFLWVTIARTM
jgi:hypothetical protein